MNKSLKAVKKVFLLSLIALFFWALFSLEEVRQNFVFAATCDTADCGSIEECQQKQNECWEIWGLYDVANEKNKEELAVLKKRLDEIVIGLSKAQDQIDQLEKSIVRQEEVLKSKEKVFAFRVRSFYKRSYQFSPLLVFLASNTASSLTRELSYRQAAADEDRKAIASLSISLNNLEKDKQSLEEKGAWLEKTQAEISQTTLFLDREVAKAEAYLGSLKGRIAQLSAKQEALLAARAGTFTTSVGEVPISNIPCSGPPGSPSFCDPGGGDWFGAFSFGGWTHRKGMSQYGAKGRAEAGQNASQILQAYYGREPVGKDTGGAIQVTGIGALDFENYYLMGIAEMPSGWSQEALRAQAIAARSFAYRYKSQGRAICTTQACQVFSSSKANNPPSAWRQAVESTRGQVIEEVVAFYSSTAGGYLTYPTGLWDTIDGQGGPGFASRAWESKAGSPWFYSSWYTQNFTASSAKCGRSHPWLTAEEMADILNAWQVLTHQENDSRILPETINQCPIGGVSGSPYSKIELKERAESLGRGFSRVSGVTVIYSQNGETSSVNLETDRGSVSLAGSEFKQAFNLRAPGYIAIRSPLFSIERK
ncbi:MAG: hypothetical protein JW991_03675 [Candidatus Pacebacteria bacterium]|nr:hypothetical protein [Candidatus Paceibacterota bacterium]